MGHHLEIDASDHHSAPRLVLVCTAAPGSGCRKRPTDDRERWYLDDPDLVDGDCWAVDFIDAAGWDDGVRADDFDGTPWPSITQWPRIPVTVHYDEGVIVAPIGPPDHTLAIAEAARAYVAIQRRGVTTVADRMQAWDRLTAAVDAERAAQGPACTCPETDPAVREVTYTVLSLGAEPHMVTCPRHGMKRADVGRGEADHG